MKKIYTITLDDDVPLSDDTYYSNVREIAFWLYEELGKFDHQILCIDNDKEMNADGLRKNELYDVPYNGGYVYRFDSDNVKGIDNRLFEPFVLDNKTFGFTVYDGSISDSELAIILDGVLKILQLNHHYSINSVLYDDTNIKNRFKAIEAISQEEKPQNNVKKLVKVPLKLVVSMINLW